MGSADGRDRAGERRQLFLLTNALSLLRSVVLGLATPYLFGLTCGACLQASPVGTFTVKFTTAINATLDYSVSGTTGTTLLTRLIF
jgi:hypothetical protein